MISSSSISPASPGPGATTPAAAADPAETAAGAGVPEGLDRLRIVLAAAMGTILVSYAMLVPVAGAVLFTGGHVPSLDQAFAAAIPMWLAAHQIPLVLEQQPLALLPLLPTLVLALVVARGARWTVRKLGGGLRHDAGVVITALAGGHAAVAVLAGALLPRAAAVAVGPWSAMVGSGLVTAAAAAIGVLRGSEWPDEWRAVLRGWPAAAGAAALVGAIGLGLLGSAAVLAGLGFGIARVEAVVAGTGPGVGPAAGMALLALAYLPNAVVGGASWVLGPGVGVGAGWWTPFGGSPGPVPRFPWFAALPTMPSPSWAVAVVLGPAMLGLLMGTVCRRVLGPSTRTTERLAATVVAAVTLALLTGLAGVLAGGRLGAGHYDPISVPPLLLLPAVLVWIGGPACLTALIQREPKGFRGESRVANERMGKRAVGQDADEAGAENSDTANGRRARSSAASEASARKPSSTAGDRLEPTRDPSPQRALPRRFRPEQVADDRSEGPQRSAVRWARAVRALRRSRGKPRTGDPAAPEPPAGNGRAPGGSGDLDSRVQAAARSTPAERVSAKSLRAERVSAGKVSVKDSSATSSSGGGGPAGSVSADTEAVPLTVGELVALRARLAAQAAETPQTTGDP